MNIIEPSVEIITEPNPLKRIELCGRVCYKSEDRITPDSARKFVENIIKRGHTSVLEHARVNVPNPPDGAVGFALIYGLLNRMNETRAGGMAMNARDFIAMGGTLDQLAMLENAEDYMTVRFVCDRAIANELVRHRVFSFSQESTRYVSYKDGVTFVRPLPFEWAEEDKGWNHRYSTWIHTMGQIEKMYQELMDSGCTPQEARNVLPLSTKTELLMTGTHQQWTDMLKLRLDRAAHPQMRYLMELLTQHELFPEDVTLRKRTQENRTI